MPIFQDAKLSTGAVLEVLRYRSVRREHIQAIEGQNATSPCYLNIGVFQASSDSGLILAGGPTVVPGGQVYWSGDLWLNPDEEIQARFNYCTAADKLCLTVKTAKYPSEAVPA